MQDILRISLEKLFDLRNPQKRSLEFERLLDLLLVENGFQVHRNPKAAKPRQTDLVARHYEKDFLIEAKWLSRKIDVSDIDSLRSRLARTPADFVGCIFSMSDYTRGAIQEVEEHREREILLFNPFEVHRFFIGRTRILDVIEQKRSALRTNARVYFLCAEEKSMEGKSFSLPEPDETIFRGSEALSSICCAVIHHGDEILFARESFDIGWTVLGGEPVGLHLTLDLENVPDLQQLLGAIHNHLHLSTRGSFVIQQNSLSWNGIGLQNFFSEVARWKDRYERDHPVRLHHSEELAYFDVCEAGFLVLTARQRVGDSSFLHGGELVIWLPGTPIQLEPFQALCRETGNSTAYFSHRKSNQYDEVRLKKPMPVEPVAEIRRTDQRNRTHVSGIVVKNPFFKKRPKFPNSRLDYSPFFLLGRTEYLVCRLSDWHTPGDVVDRYFLTRLEGAWTGATVPVFRPVCTWGEILRHAESEQSTEQSFDTVLQELYRSERISRIVEAHTKSSRSHKRRRPGRH